MSQGGCGAFAAPRARQRRDGGSSASLKTNLESLSYTYTRTVLGAEWANAHPGRQPGPPDAARASGRRPS